MIGGSKFIMIFGAATLSRGTFAVTHDPDMTHQQVSDAKGESVDGQAANRIFLQTMIMVDGVKQTGGNNHV